MNQSHSIGCQQELHTQRHLGISKGFGSDRDGGHAVGPPLHVPEDWRQFSVEAMQWSSSTCPRGLKTGERGRHAVGPPLHVPEDWRQLSLEAMQWVLLYMSQRIEDSWAWRLCSGPPLHVPEDWDHTLMEAMQRVLLYLSQMTQNSWAWRPCSGSSSTCPRGFKSVERGGHAVGPPLRVPEDSSQLSVEAMQWVLLYISQRIQVSWAWRPCSGSSSTYPRGFRSDG
jgi:hypothetical protein